MKTLYENIHQEIIDQCRKGSRKAQFQLYKLYYRPMFSICMRLINNTAEAEDVMQEAFLNAFTKIDAYKGEVSFGAWLKRIVINRSLDYLKKRKIKFGEINEKTNQLPDYQMEIKEVNMDVIKGAIQKLPDGYRVVLSLFLIEGYDHEEISEILGISNSNSRTQYLRAKNKLKELLKDTEVFSYN
ncbi:MAG: sigma-70 family RNA polymerase sigma [Prolixibacteraceae bacterium]|nr:MAG: sigma-70 family RNA polymerase sigma [Prolixibacteraceae bacterium]